MTPIIENAWTLLENEYQKYSKENVDFILDKNKKEYFKQAFKKHYNEIKDNYMLPSVKYLDRHKVAAIIIVSILESNAVSYNNLDKDCVFIGNELLAIKVGLAYMTENLNEKLSEKNVGKKIEKVVFPEALSCETSYIEIMCRNLYIAKTDYKLNPLDIADRLFLLEYIILLKNGIDTSVLKEA